MVSEIVQNELGLSLAVSSSSALANSITGVDGINTWPVSKPSGFGETRSLHFDRLSTRVSSIFSISWGDAQVTGTLQSSFGSKAHEAAQEVSFSRFVSQVPVTLPHLIEKIRQGRVFLTGPHPEWEEDSDRDGVDYVQPSVADRFDDQGSDWDLMRNAARWCLHEID